MGQSIQEWTSEICGRQPAQADHIILDFLKAISHKFHLVYS